MLIGQIEALPLDLPQIIINRSFTEKRVPMRPNHHLATFVSIGKEFSVSFDFVPTNLTPGWKNVLHMSNTNSDCCARGSRLPAVFFRREKEISYIYVGTDLNENGNYVYAQQEDAIRAEKNVNIRIQQAKFGPNYIYTISINGRVVWGISNDSPQEFSEVKMYCSSPWYPSQEGVMTNLEVLSS